MGVEYLYMVFVIGFSTGLCIDIKNYIGKKISNFKPIKTKGTSVLNYEYFATIDVTHGHLWWKNTESKVIYREYAGPWFYTADGKFAEPEVDELYRSYKSCLSYET